MIAPSPYLRIEGWFPCLASTYAIMFSALHIFSMKSIGLLAYVGTRLASRRNLLQDHHAAVMAQVDALWEEEPSLPFDHLVAMEFLWPLEPYDQVLAAAIRIMDGLWAFYLGNWCPEEMDTLQWRGRSLVASEDEPLGYQLQMVGMTLRYDGCRLASRFATPKRLNELRAYLRHSRSPQERAFREAVLTWMEQLSQQYHTQQDWFGTPLPASLEYLSAAFAQSEPYRKQGNTSVVTAIAVGRQQYFVKRLIEPGPLLTLLPVFQTECAVIALLNALPWKIGPHTGCLYVGDDGVLSYLSNKVPGITMKDIRKAASRVSLASVQAAVFAEFVVGAVEDRHTENIFIDRIHAQPWLIDFANALGNEVTSLELPAADLPLEDQREAFTRALWIWHPDRLETGAGETVILDDILMGFLGGRSAMLTALAPFDLPDEAQQGMIRRFDVLERFAHETGERTLEKLNRVLLG